jgi:hypothetical protein
VWLVCECAGVCQEGACMGRCIGNSDQGQEVRDNGMGVKSSWQGAITRCQGKEQRWTLCPRDSSGFFCNDAH